MLISVRLDDEVVASLDALGGKRSDLIREAIGLLLDRDGQVGGVRTVSDVVKTSSGPERPERKKSDVVVPARKPEIRQPRKRDFSGDFPAVLGVLSEHRYSSRDLAKRLGWAEMRLDKVLAAMGAAGLVRFERGLVVAA